MHALSLQQGLSQWFLLGCSFADAMASFIPRRVPVMEVMAFLVKRRMTARQVRLCPAGKVRPQFVVPVQFISVYINRCYL